MVASQVAWQVAATEVHVVGQQGVQRVGRAEAMRVAWLAEQKAAAVGAGMGVVWKAACWAARTGACEVVCMVAMQVA